MPVSPSSALPSNLLRRYQPELVQYMPLSQARIQTPGLALYADPVHTLTHLLVGYSVDGCIPHTMALMNAVGIHGLPDDIDSYYPTPRELIRQTVREAYTKGPALAASLMAKADNGWTRLDAMRIAHLLRLGYSDPEQAKAQHVLRLAAKTLKIRAYLPITANVHLYRTLNRLGQLQIHPELLTKLQQHGLKGLNGDELRAMHTAAMLCIHATSAQFGVSMEELDAWYWEMSESKTTH